MDPSAPLIPRRRAEAGQTGAFLPVSEPRIAVSISGVHGAAELCDSGKVLSSVEAP
jgi:hypothetical protein